MLARIPCPWCGGIADPTTTCPKAIDCPNCGVPGGLSCKRPSGHRADELHAARIAAAEARPPRTPPAQLELD